MYILELLQEDKIAVFFHWTTADPSNPRRIYICTYLLIIHLWFVSTTAGPSSRRRRRPLKLVVLLLGGSFLQPTNAAMTTLITVKSRWK